MAIVLTFILANGALFIIDDLSYGSQVIQSIIETISSSNTANAQETIDIQLDSQRDTHTFPPSLYTQQPSVVIDQTILPLLPETDCQSPPKEGQDALEENPDLLKGLVPIYGNDINYCEILGISEEEIMTRLLNEKITIWDIATDLEEANLLENVYSSIYPARIIAMVNECLITNEMADVLIDKAMHDIVNHKNIDIDDMIKANDTAYDNS